MANQSVYSATIERRTVISSGFPPKTQMELISICVGRVNQSCGPGSTVETSAHLFSGSGLSVHKSRETAKSL